MHVTSCYLPSHAISAAAWRLSIRPSYLSHGGFVARTGDFCAQRITKCAQAVAFQAAPAVLRPPGPEAPPRRWCGETTSARPQHQKMDHQKAGRRASKRAGLAAHWRSKSPGKRARKRRDVWNDVMRLDGGGATRRLLSILCVRRMRTVPLGWRRRSRSVGGDAWVPLAHWKCSGIGEAFLSQTCS